MSISKIRYSSNLFKKQLELENNLTLVKEFIAEAQSSCEHIMVGLGYIGTYQCRDNSYQECLFCRKASADIVSDRFINATNYKEGTYGHGELEIDRENKLKEIQDLYIAIKQTKKNLTDEEVIELINDEIKKEEEHYKIIKKSLNINN